MGNNPSTKDTRRHGRRDLPTIPDNRRHAFKNKNEGAEMAYLMKQIYNVKGGGTSFSDFYHEVGKENRNTFMNGMAMQVGGNKQNTLETILNWLIILYAVGLVVLIVVRLLNPDIPFTWCYDGFLSVSALLLFVLFVPTVLKQ